jgi:hypothetical protein
VRSKKEEGQVDRNMSSSKIVVIVYLSHVQSMIVMSVIALPRLERNNCDNRLDRMLCVSCRRF